MLLDLFLCGQYLNFPSCDVLHTSAPPHSSKSSPSLDASEVSAYVLCVSGSSVVGVLECLLALEVKVELRLLLLAGVATCRERERDRQTDRQTGRQTDR